MSHVKLKKFKALLPMITYYYVMITLLMILIMGETDNMVFIFMCDVFTVIIFALINAVEHFFESVEFKHQSFIAYDYVIINHDILRYSNAKQSGITSSAWV